MKRALWPLSLALVALFACKSAPKPFPDDPSAPVPAVRIRFAPKDGTELRERLVNLRTERSSAGELQESVTFVMNSRFERAGEGWMLTQTVPEVSISVNGQKIESNLAQLVTKFPVQVRLAADGTFVRLLNDQQIVDVVRAELPEDASEQLVSAFSPEAIEEQTRKEWNDKYGELLGRELAEGSAWYTVESLLTTQGEVTYVLEHAFSGTRTGEQGLEVVISHNCPTSPDKAKRADAMEAALQAKGNPALEPSITCAGQQVLAVDPFVPLSNTLEVRARGKEPSGQPFDVSFNREVRREAPAARSETGAP